MSTKSLQTSDDDIPSNTGDFKTLFASSKIIKSSPTIISCSFSIDVQRCQEGFDLNSVVKVKSDESFRQVKQCEFLGEDCQTLQFTQQSDHTLITKAIAWQAFPSLWLCIFLSGDTEDNFEQANDILSRVRKI